MRRGVRGNKGADMRAPEVGETEREGKGKKAGWARLGAAARLEIKSFFF